MEDLTLCKNVYRPQNQQNEEMQNESNRQQDQFNNNLSSSFNQQNKNAESDQQNIETYLSSNSKDSINNSSYISQVKHNESSQKSQVSQISPIFTKEQIQQQSVKSLNEQIVNKMENQSYMKSQDSDNQQENKINDNSVNKQNKSEIITTHNSNLYSQGQYDESSFNLNQQQVEQIDNQVAQKLTLDMIQGDYLPINKFEEIKSKLMKIQQSQFQEVLRHLQIQGYFIEEYLISGGEADILEGYKLNENNQQQQWVFRVCQTDKEQFEEIKQEYQLVTSIKEPINVIKYTDSIFIEDKNIGIFIIEKCENSFFKELCSLRHYSYQNAKRIVFQVILDLVDGLIELRAHNIVHLDIKPSNILKTFKGIYVFADFGLSGKLKNQSQIKLKGFTEYYSPPEQIRGDCQLNHSADIYSLGKTYLKIVNLLLEKVNQEKDNQIDIELLEKLVGLFKSQMIQDDQNNRIECLELPKLIINLFSEHQQFNTLQEYYKKVKAINQLNKYDNTKDIKYFIQVNQMYKLLQLQLIFILNKVSSSSSQIIKDIQCKVIKEQSVILQNKILIPQQYQEEYISVLNEIGENYLTLGEYQKSFNFYYEVLEISQQMFGELDANVAISLNNIGNCFEEIGEYDQALILFKQSLAIKKQIFEGNHILIAISLDNIGRTYQSKLDYVNAVQYCQQSLDIKKELHQGNNEHVQLSLNNLGTIYLNMGQIQKAIEYFQESLQMSQKLYDKIHPTIAQSLDNIADCYHTLGQISNALNSYLESLEIYEQIFEGDNPKLALIYNNVGSCYETLGEYEVSEQFYIKALDINKKLYKDPNKNISISLNNVGSLYLKQEKYENALKYHKEALQMAEKIFQGNNEFVAILLSSVGSSYFSLNQFNVALEYLLKSIQIQQAIKVDNTPNFSSILSNAGSCYFYLKNYEESLSYHFKAYELRKKIYNNKHFQIIASLTQICKIYTILGQQEKVFKYQLKKIKVAKSLDELSDGAVILSIKDMIQYFEQLEDYENSILYLIILKDYKQNTDKIQKDVEECLNYLSSLDNVGKNNYQEASEYLIQAKKFDQQNNISKFIEFISKLGKIYMKLEYFEKSLFYYQLSLELQQKIKSSTKEILEVKSQLADCFSLKGDIGQQQQQLNEILQILKSSSNENNQELAQNLFKIAKCQVKNKQFKEALNFYEQSQQILEKLNQQNSKLYFDCCYSSAECYEELQNDSKTEELYLKSLEILKIIGKDIQIDISPIYCNLGKFYSQIGNFEQALFYLKESLRVLLISQPGASKYASQILFNIGYCYEEQEQFQLAIDNYKQSLEVIDQILYKDDNFLQTCLFSLGSVYKNIGQPQEAVVNLLKSLEISRKLNDLIFIKDNLMLLGACYFQLSQYEIALKYFLEQQEVYQLKLQDQASNSKVANLENISQCYQRLGLIENSNNYINKAINLIIQSNGKINHQVATLYYQLGMNCNALKDYQESLKYYEQSFDILNTLFKGTHMEMVYLLIEIEKCYQNLGQQEKSNQANLQKQQIIKRLQMK